MITDEQSLRAFIREELDRSQMGVLIRQSQGLIAGLQGSTVKHGNLGVALQATGGSVSGGFSLTRPADVLMVYFATGFVAAAGTAAFFNATLDGVFRGSGGKFFNEAGSHQVLTPFAEMVSLGAGSHTVDVTAGGNLSRDTNDFSLVVYVAFG